MTWGFPSVTAFVGLMHALDRRTADDIPIVFEKVGIICHRFEPMVTTEGYNREFRLTRNPVDKDGSTAAIVEEGRAHMEVTLVFGVSGLIPTDAAAQQGIADIVADALSTMRVAGGSIVPTTSNQRSSRATNPALISMADDREEWQKTYKRLRRSWLPGFALVSRHDLLKDRLMEIQAKNKAATLLDAWLDLSSMQITPRATEQTDPQSEDMTEVVVWDVVRKPGWLVPIPVGYGALSDVIPAGGVTRARDSTTPFRFVETLYSVGEWVSPHRLLSVEDMLWSSTADIENGLYECVNHSRKETDVA